MLNLCQDLHTRNILFALQQIDSLSIDELYQRFGEPFKTEIERIDGAPLGVECPAYSVAPANLVISSDEVSDPRIMLSEFGEAWINDTDTWDDLNTPVLYSPPEVTFAKESIGYPADVWTLGCTVYEILGDGALFEGFLSDRDFIIAEIVSTMGLLSQQWWDSWRARDEFFLEDGSWRTDMKRSHQPKSRPLLLRIHENGREKEPDFSEEEALSLHEMLTGMLTYEPSKRAIAGEVVRSDWMQRWGLPALKKLV